VKTADPLRLTAADVEAYKWSFSRAGAIPAALRYYQNVLTPATADFNSRVLSSRRRRLPMPTLLVWGDQDTALGAELTAGTDALCADFRLRVIHGASHWVQQDAVSETLDAVGDFLHVKPDFSALPAGGAAGARVSGPRAGSDGAASSGSTVSGGGRRSSPDPARSHSGGGARRRASPAAGAATAADS
jgi:hypothetical protein